MSSDESSDESGGWSMVRLKPEDFTSGMSINEIVEKNGTIPLKGKFKAVSLKPEDFTSGMSIHEIAEKNTK